MSLTIPLTMRDATGDVFRPLGPPERLRLVKPPLGPAPDWFATEPHEIDARTGAPCAASSPVPKAAGKNDSLDAMLEHAVAQGWPVNVGYEIQQALIREARQMADWVCNPPLTVSADFGRPGGDETAIHAYLYGDFTVSNEPSEPTFTLASPAQRDASVQLWYHAQNCDTAATDLEARQYTERLKLGKVTVQEAEYMERRMKLRKRIRGANRGEVLHY